MRKRGRGGIAHLVFSRSTAGRKRPHDVLVIVDVDVGANEHKAVDRVPGFGAKDQVADLLTQLLRIDFGRSDLDRIELKDDPGDLRGR